MNEANSSHRLTRRHFLTTTSSAVAGSAILGTLSIPRNVFASTDETLKIALIGCGARGTGAASQALSTKGATKLVAMADVFPEKLSSSLSQLKNEHSDKIDVPQDRQFVSFDGYKKAIALADVVILTTPPGFRPSQFEEAVKQGKHVFMEKPVAVDAPGVRKVLAAAEEAKRKNLKVGVGLQRRHQSGYLETVQRLHDGAIGDILAMRAYWVGGPAWLHKREDLEKQAGRKLTEMEYQMRNWYQFNWLCGDHIAEQHIHNLDVINWIKNAHPTRAQGQGGREVRKGRDTGELFDHHFVEFEYADGSILSSQCRHINGCWSRVSEHTVGTKGTADLDAGGHWKITGPNAWRFKKENQANPYQQEHDDLFDAIRNNKPFNEAEFAAISSMTAILGRMATYSGRMIEWDEALNSKIDLMPEVLAWDASPRALPDANGLYPVAVPGQAATI